MEVRREGREGRRERGEREREGGREGGREGEERGSQCMQRGGGAEEMRLSVIHGFSA